MQLCNYISERFAKADLKERATHAMKIIIVSNQSNKDTLDALFQIVAYLDAQGEPIAAANYEGAGSIVFTVHEKGTVIVIR